MLKRKRLGLTTIKCLLVVLLPSCGPPDPWSPTYTGHQLTPEQHDNALERYNAGVQCGLDHGGEISRDAPEIYVHSTCWFKLSGYGYVRGYTNQRDKVEIGLCTRAQNHEIVSLVFGSHSHSPESLTILCEHAGPKPFECACEPKPM